MPPTMTPPVWFLFPSSSGACGSCASTLRVFSAETRLTVYRWPRVTQRAEGFSLRAIRMQGRLACYLADFIYQFAGVMLSEDWTPAVNRQPGFRREDS